MGLADHLFESPLAVGARVAADAQNHAEIDARDEGRRTASGDHRQRLARDREESDGHHHVEHGLRYKHEGQTHDEEGWEVTFAATRYASRSYEENDVEEGDGGGTP